MSLFIRTMSPFIYNATKSMNEEAKPEMREGGILAQIGASFQLSGDFFLQSKQSERKHHVGYFAKR